MSQFKRGNLVKVLTGHPWYTKDKDGVKQTGDFSPEEIGQEAIVDYNYADKYKNTSFGHSDSYSIIFMRDDSRSWRKKDELEFIEDGGEYLFKKAQENKKKMYEEMRKTYENLKNEGLTISKD